MEGRNLEACNFNLEKKKNGEKKAVRSRGWGAWLANTHTATFRCKPL